MSKVEGAQLDHVTHFAESRFQRESPFVEFVEHIQIDTPTTSVVGNYTPTYRQLARVHSPRSRLTSTLSPLVTTISHTPRRDSSPCPRPPPRPHRTHGSTPSTVHPPPLPPPCPHGSQQKPGQKEVPIRKDHVLNTPWDNSSSSRTLPFPSRPSRSSSRTMDNMP